MSTDAQQDSEEFHAWQRWHERRIVAVAAPHGPLSLTGTHWLADHPEGRIPAVPGLWREENGEVVLTATPDDGLTVDAKPLAGEVRLGADRGPIDTSRVAQGQRRLVVLSREGLWAVRDFDPQSPARQAFRTIDATPYDPKWSLEGTFRPYASDRTVRVQNADGRERGLGLSGEIAFTLDGAEHTLQVAVEPDGSLWAVFADATSGNGSYRFRFLRPEAPDAEGRVRVDFNRTLLPPCAFADHFICPFPPPGNTLTVAVPAGERNRIDG
ncbi:MULTISPECIES: DUF1684 domain-containing protein [unclassified Streptomyces]|uniref:DUF1684 domain-containing protein n=1 Tax=unclassified Streptomyces TaxID=2593676 RepID=UPI0029BF8F73|nr:MULTISPECIES: DUF1684 domain-containing protein [unclassified Streptomyces]MDX3429674.1 DUF1684 domain-containing protein [Streptomyces sp. ME01-18a]MDX3687577.1 DUF1684 domain-containing protein [Streptomyces sp. AK04-4c]